MSAEPQSVELTIEQRLAVAEAAVLHLATKLELRTRQLADARQQFTEELAPLLRQAKREAWTASANAHLEYMVSGDPSNLDCPYEEEENELA